MNKIQINKEQFIAKTDPKLFSAFLEHMGRAIYTGIYEPGHPLSDEDGFRTDVLQLVKDLKLEYIRYPGGNFVSGYNWKNGIGKNRLSTLELAWKTIEPNEVGIGEFYKWTKKANTKIMGAINLGTGSPNEAREFLEYCNFEKGTKWSNKRQENGFEQPFKIDLWCLGNEMDGPWQIGHLDALEYAKKARETAKLMKWVDSDIKLVGVGSSGPNVPTFPKWDREVLEILYDNIEYISLHRYYYNVDNPQDFLACHKDLDSFIKTVGATVDYVKALKRSKKDIYLSLDEWNIWYMNKIELKDWEVAPRILEDNYSFLDSLAFSAMVITILNNANRVKISCLAQLVNVIAPIFTEPNGISFKQTIYYPFYYFTNYGRGIVLDAFQKVPTIKTKYSDDTEAIISATVYDDIKKEVNIFILNCDIENDHKIELMFEEFEDLEFIEQFALEEDDLYITNTVENPEVVKPKKLEGLNLELRKSSFNLIRFKEKDVF